MQRTACVTCLSGVVLLAANAALAFEPELVERLPGAIDDHTLVMLDGTRVVAAGERDDGGGNEAVWASLRSETGRWSVPEILEFSQGRSRGVQLAVDGSGAALVVWVQDERRLTGLWANRRVPGEGWQEPSRIEPVAGELYAPQIALDTAGRGMAVWERRAGERLQIRASRYTPEIGWSPPEVVDAGEGDSVAPRVAVHDDGSAVVAWTAERGPRNRRVVARRFSPGAGWGPEHRISADGADAYDVRIAMDAGGNAFATWEQTSGGRETVYAGRFHAGAGWGQPVRLEIDGEEGHGPRLAVSPDGDAVVAWIRAAGESGAVVAARYTREFHWQRPVIVQSGELLYVFDLEVAAGAHGGVLATWCQTDGSRNNVWYARFDGRSQWQRAALAEHRTGSAHRPRPAAAPDGSLGLIWKMVDAPLPDQALYSLWFRRVQ
ncbi:MAG: hypothetical protein R3286_17570 [Gammaproteobacteria bacterium]|nr:hypothetical protein [Gammaproteobacteria bacterium]